MKRKILTQIIAFGILITLLSSSHVLGAPLNGVQGSRIQAYFMSQDPDPADAGKDVDIRWQVVNTLSTPVDLKFHLDAEYPLCLRLGIVPTGTWGNRQVRTITRFIMCFTTNSG